MRGPRLNDCQRVAILDAYRAGDKTADLAARYHVTPSYISQLAKAAGLRRGKGAPGRERRKKVLP